MDGHDKNDAAGSADNLDKSNASGAAKGIFSTPDLTVNTENLPQNQPVKPAGSAARFNFGRRANRGGANAESSERVASAFAQTDASQQSQRLNEAMLENANAATQSTATGDIQLDVPKKRKKWPWLILGLLVIAVVGALVFFVLTKNNEGAESPKQEISLKEPFYRYVNYLLSGNDSTDKPADIMAMVDTSSAVSEFYKPFSNSERASYFEKAQSLLNTFVEGAQNNVEVKNSDANVTVHDLAVMNETQFTSLRKFIAVPDITLPIMMSYYLQHGADDLISYIQTTYNAFTESNDEVLSAIVSRKSEMAASVNSLLGFYTADGCLVAGELDEACIERSSQREDVGQIQGRLLDLESEIMQYSDSLLYNLFTGCQNTLRVIDGEVLVTEEDA